MDKEQQLGLGLEKAAKSIVPKLDELKVKLVAEHPRTSLRIIESIDKVRQQILQVYGDQKEEDEIRAAISIRSSFEFHTLKLSDALASSSKSSPPESGSSQSSSEEFSESDRIIKDTTGFRLTDSNLQDATKLVEHKVQLKSLDVNWSSETIEHIRETCSGNVLLTVLDDILSSSRETLSNLRIEAFLVFDQTNMRDAETTCVNLKHLHLYYLPPKTTTSTEDKSKLSQDDGKVSQDKSRVGQDKSKASQDKSKASQDKSKASREPSELVKWPIIPAGLKLAEVLPHLITLVLEMPTVKFEKKILKKYFPGDEFHLSGSSAYIDSLASVKNLALDCKFSMAGLKAMGKKFPNVTTVLVKNVKDFFMNDDSVWFIPWEGLVNLELRGFLLGDNFNSRDMDSFFTGFSPEICSKLRESGQQKVSVDPRVLKVFPSVRDLKNLRRLRIVFDHPENGTASDVSQKTAGFSHITGLYTFGLMPQLEEIEFGYDFNLPTSKNIAEVLEPLARFVKFVHHPMLSSFGKGK